MTLPNDGDVLNYLTKPVRSGYVFMGWYTDSACTVRYDYPGTISEDITLYAGWTEMSMGDTYYGFQLDPTVYTSDSEVSVSTQGTTSSNQYHYYVVAGETGTHKIYFKNSTSSSSYRYCLRIYNLTTGTMIRNNATVTNATYSYTSFECSVGDVIVLSIYKYSNSSSYYSTASFYFEGFSSMASSSVADFDEYVYATDSSYSEQVTYGTTVTLPTPVKADKTFAGWYNGDIPVESGAWNLASDVTLTAKWE